MKLTEKYDRIGTGLISGLILPLIVAVFVFLFSKGNPGLGEWLKKVMRADIVSHIITLCVFPNVFIFLLFNHFDMLRASRGVLGITMFWAVIVFAVYFLL
jgi:hypothetical protein